MKKMIMPILVVIGLIALLCSCSCPYNAYTHVHIADHAAHVADLTIIEWRHLGRTGVAINTEECGWLVASEGSYIMFNDTCPLCSN